MAETSEKFNIKLNIAGKSYPLTIERAMEEKYRRAEREVNQLVAKFRGRFRAESQDYLAMAALQIAVSNVELEMSRSLGEELDALKELDIRLGEHFSEV
ncbi:MAG: cell division protein ZapA [Rikenellaceae bacterium]|nr:cell division protein ZapA [Rikenellaceae bacterium]